MAENIFSENVDCLIRIKQEVAERDEMTASLKAEKDALKKQTKAAAAEEKSIQDEIQSTIKKRRKELEAGYDKQLDSKKSELKKVTNKKEGEKNQKKKARVKEETSDSKAEIKEIEKQLKEVFKNAGVPGICRTKLFYIMFMPKGMHEIIRMIGMFILLCVAIPLGLFGLFAKVVFRASQYVTTPQMICTVGVPILWIILMVVIYFLVYTSVLRKYKDTMEIGRGLRNDIMALEENIEGVEKSIKKDKDESSYDLGAYDEKIDAANAEIESISAEKAGALKVFNDETAKAIEEEILGRRDAALQEMKQANDAKTAELKSLEDQITERSKAITTNYASYIGEEFCKIDKLDALIAIMQEGNAATVSEAIAYFKANPKKGQAKNSGANNSDNNNSDAGSGE